ncbi:eCIS core domain-containing protein [Chitinophaga sp. 22620]|uniref:eCIS core domain-containing protein n=1 Tax=Chitinophaga sp. 22620 TaxID=3453952 RepID=UPI003F866671
MPATEGALPFFGGSPVQAKLEVSPPDDPQEREADNVADTVMRMPEGGDTIQPYAEPVPAMVQRKCASCEAEETVHRFPEPAVARPGIVQRKCAACGQEEQVQRKCASCEAEETVHRFPEPAVARPEIVQRKCAACEQEEQVQRKCASCEAEETVQRFPEPAVQRKGIIQRSCDECKIAPPEKEETAEDNETEESLVEKDASVTPDAEAAAAVQPKAAPGGTDPVSSQFESGLNASKGGGQPMTEPVRRNMENRFGLDFADVRIHNNHHATNLSASINAQAFTHGKDIYFNQNKYDGTSAGGQRLLAHELTHVVQQTGTSVVKPKIQRLEEPKIGNWAHSWIQKHMREADNQLITEAGIPGAVRYAKGLNLAGFADLYKADNNAVSGMQAHEAGEKGKYEYLRFMESGKRKEAMKGPFKRGPKKNSKDQWDFTVNFPETFQIGEIKPLYWTEFGVGAATLVGNGILQQNNYILGFKEFVEHVFSVFGSPARSTTTGTPMDLSKLIPDGLNYDKFDAEHTKLGKGHTFKLDTKQRLWVANIGSGMAGYFLMPHPYIPTEFAADKKKHRDKMDALIKSLREDAGKPTLPATIKAKRIQCKPAITASVKPEAVRRKPGDKTKDPNAAAEAWEKKRKAWANGTDTDVTQKPKKFLKERAKGLLKRNKVDKDLKKTTPSDVSKEIKDVKDVRFWSSFKGRVFGALRFRFRRAFDKVEELFNKIKGKFEKHKEKSKTLTGGKKFTISWKKEAVNLIVQLAVDIFQRMIVIAFEGFSKCMSTIVDAIIGKYEKALESAAEEQLKEFEPVCCKIMEFKNTWEAEVEKHDKVITTFTQTVDDMREWVAILDKVELAVRVGVQIISCGTPPALGCLWGLVAQLGISAGMALVQKTDYWKNNIAQPAAQALMEAIVGDKLHNMMIDVMKGTPLGAYMSDKACQPRQKGAGGGSGGLDAIGQGLDKIDPNDPAVAQARAEWEEKYKDQIMADLKQFFESGQKGKPITPEDLQKMVDAIKNSKKTPDELKKMIEEGRNVKTGKVDITKALSTVTSDTVPADKPKKERKINYENARRNNLYYFNMLHWAATLFIKKPGIQPGSDEFAEAVYDMQEALGIHADGIAGAGTTQKFYDANGLKQDGVYTAAVALEAKEKQEKADRKATEEAKKQIEAILKDPKVQESLGKAYPSRDELKKELTASTWSFIPKGEAVFVKRKDGLMFVVFRSHEDAILGAFIKVAEWDQKGEIVDKIVETGEFFAVNDVPKMDAIGYSSRDLAATQDMMDNFVIISLSEARPAGTYFSLDKWLLFGLNLKRTP